MAHVLWHKWCGISLVPHLPLLAPKSLYLLMRAYMHEGKHMEQMRNLPPSVRPTPTLTGMQVEAGQATLCGAAAALLAKVPPLFAALAASIFAARLLAHRKRSGRYLH